MSSKELYTVMVPQKVVSQTTKGEVVRNIVTTYYDVAWEQVGFYGKKHGASHIDVTCQYRRLGSPPDVKVIGDINWSDEAREGTRRLEEARVKLGGAATKPVSVKPALPPVPPKMRPGEKIKIDMGYGDLVNAMVKEA